MAYDAHRKIHATSYASHHGNANRSHNEMSLYIYRNGQNPERQDHHTLARLWRNEDSPRLVGTQHGVATSEDSLSLSYETKHTLTIRSNNHISWDLLKGVMSTQKTARGYLQQLYS